MKDNTKTIQLSLRNIGKGNYDSVNIESPIKSNYGNLIQTGDLYSYVINQFKSGNIRTSWANDCLNKMAQSVSDFKIYLYKRNTTKTSRSDLGIEVFEHPFFDVINSKGIYGKFFGTTIYLATISLMLYGKCFIYKQRDKLKRVTSLTTLPPSSIRVETINGINKYFISTGKTVVEKDDSEIMYIVKPSIENPFCGEPLLNSMVEWIDKDNLQQRFEKAIYENYGAVGLIFETPDEITEEMMAYYDKMLINKTSGVDFAGQGIVLGNKMTVKTLTPALKEMNFVEISNSIRDNIFAKFQIPKILFGIADDKFTNTQSGLHMYLRCTIRPFAELLFVDIFNAFVKEEYGKEYTVVFEYPILPTQEEISLHDSMVSSNRYSDNEIRGLYNYGSVVDGDIIPSISDRQNKNINGV